MWNKLSGQSQIVELLHSDYLFRIMILLYLTIHSHMRKSITALFVFITAVILVQQVQTVDLILYANQPTCSVLISAYEAIKVQVEFPPVPNKAEGDVFTVSLVNTQTMATELQMQQQDNSPFRKQFTLQHNLVYWLCFQWNSRRTQQDEQPIFVDFKAEQDFENLQGLTIPPELTEQGNVRTMYSIAQKMDKFNQMTISHQTKEREMEDKLVDLSSHKAHRVVTLTVIECAVIVISGIYQILALRSFLIHKNLY